MGACFNHIGCACTHTPFKPITSNTTAAALGAQSGWTTTAEFCSPGDAPLGECTATNAELNIDNDAVQPLLGFVVPVPLLSVAIEEGLGIDPKELVGQASTDPFLTPAELAKIYPQTQGQFPSQLSIRSALIARS